MLKLPTGYISHFARLGAVLLALSAPLQAAVDAVQPQSSLYVPGAPTAIVRPTPQFPDWFGKGLRAIRAVSGEGRAVALLIDFPDRRANTLARPDSFYRELFFSRGTHPKGSFRDFYLEQSHGAFDVTGNAYGWFRTSDEYYTAYDDGYYGFAGGARAVFVAAVYMADPTVDFGLFDSDGPDGIPNSGDDDGYVDACLIFFSGLGSHDTNDPSDIYPHAIGIEPPIETNDPRAGGGFILVETYSMQPEINLNAARDDTLDSFLGVLAHEYGHHIGLADFYDGSNKTWGIGYWGLMGYGSFGALRTGPYHLSAYNKVALGWITPTVVTGNMLDITVPPIETDPVIYKVWRDGIPGEEYFLLENRQNIGFDTFLPGRGLLIWHVDETMFPRQTIQPTEDAAPEGWFRVALEQADGRNQLATWFERPYPRAYYPEMGDGGDPFPGDSLNTRFDDYSNPSSRDNSGLSTGVSIVDIALEGNDIRLSIVVDSSTVAVYFSDFRASVRVNSVELAWNVIIDEALDGFRIYRRQAGSGRDISITRDDLIPRDKRNYMDRDVRPGESYRYVISAVRTDGSELMSRPIEVSIASAALVLHQNYPNPFNPATIISFSLPEEVMGDLSIYNVKGKFIRTLKNGKLPGGSQQVVWNGKDWRGSPVGPGVYFCRLKAGKHLLVKKMVLFK